MKKELHIYCLKDRVTETISQFMLLDGEREVKTTYINFLEKQPDSTLSRYSQDYDIYELGTIDQENGAVKENLLQVCNLSCLKPETKE